jgi:hypothetical protein
MKLIYWKIFLLACVLILGQGLAKAQRWRALPSSSPSWSVYAAAAFSDRLLLLDAGDISEVERGEQLRLRYLGEGIDQVVSVWDKAAQEDSVLGHHLLMADSVAFVIYTAYNGAQQLLSLLKFSFRENTWYSDTVLNKITGQGAEIVSAEYFKGLLFLAGFFPAQGGNGMAVIDPLSNIFDTFFHFQGQISGLAAFEDKLHIGGDFDSVNHVPYSNMAVLDGTYTLSAFPFSVGKIDFVKSVRDSALVYSENNGAGQRKLRALFSGETRLRDLGGNIPEEFEFRGAASRNNSFYVIMSGSGPGFFPPGVLSVERDGKMWPVRTPSAPDHSRLISAGSKLFLVDLSAYSAIPAVHVLQKNQVEGFVYFDRDNSCSYSSSDPGLPGIMVADTSSGAYTYTDSTGYYSIELDTGLHYLVYGNYGRYFDLSACGGTDFVHLYPDAALVRHVPFATSAPGKEWNLHLSSDIGWRARQGFTEKYTLGVTNEGAGMQKCLLELSIPKEMQWVDTDFPLLDSFDRLYRWELELAPFESRTIRFRTRLGITVPAYEKLQLSVNTGSCLDVLYADSLLVQVVGAFDPNDKHSYPDSILYPGTEYIRYHVNFQNTGTDTAYRVTVVDTVDINLPLKYLKITGASHPFVPRVENNTLIFVFDDILLPDSGRDLNGSMGYLNYMAAVNPGMKEGDSILNKAYIYFDYQKPIITNTVIGRLDKKRSIVQEEPEEEEILLFPNPSRGYFTIDYPVNEAMELGLFDISGRQVKAFRVEGAGRSSYRMEDLPPGAYCLRDASGKFSRILIISR